MKCVKCKTKNIIKASFCKKCGYKFSDLEKKTARKKTLIGKIEFLEKLYNKFSLKFITDHILFKILTLLIVLIIGIYFWVKNGLDLKLLNSDYYEVQYNINLNEYYLITEKNETPLNLYIPNRIEDINIIHYDKANNVIEQIEYNKKEDIILEAYSEDYYVLEALYKNDKKQKIKIFVLQK